MREVWGEVNLLLKYAYDGGLESACAKALRQIRVISKGAGFLPLLKIKRF